ncbi:lysophospholipid acyltransferase family protein [Rhodococcus spongiicola]|nr:lysophospholipid acyltransferase family protein [Rhodococcus spongiicola]
MEPVYAAVEWAAQGMSTFQGLRFTRVGVENLPRDGGAVLAINHTGYLDFVSIGLTARSRGRRIRFMAKAELADNPVLRFLMRNTRTIAVDRAAGTASYRSAVEALKAGELVGVYPEGTISRSFELKKFKSGAARMALEAGVPIVPSIVWGAQRIATKGQPLRLGRHRIPVTVVVGEPIAPDGGPESLTATLHERMAALLAEAQRDYPHPVGEPWVPRRLGGTAPTLAEATKLDEDEARARRFRAS